MQMDIQNKMQKEKQRERERERKPYHENMNQTEISKGS